jgi:hypothetical protein
VSAGERELGVVVIEAGRRPGRGGVANLAILRESGGHVVRIRGRLVVLGVTTGAGHIQAGVNPARVALRARGSNVRAGQRELGLRGVIKRCAIPIRRGVTERTILRESGGHVARIVGGLVVLQMTGITGRAQTLVNAVRMALQASRSRVLASERESGLGGVIKRRSIPVDGTVALRAILRESGGRVIRVGGALVVLQMTRRAGGAQRRVLAARMALGAGRGGMRAGQRESSRVVIECG